MSVSWALQACQIESQDFYDLRAVVQLHLVARWDTKTSMSRHVAEAVAAALNDCSHMGPEFVTLFYAIRDAMSPDDVGMLRYTALRIAEARGLAPTRAALDKDIDEFMMGRNVEMEDLTSSSSSSSSSLSSMSTDYEQ